MAMLNKKEYDKNWRKDHPKNYNLAQKKWNRKIMHELKINGCAKCGYDKCDGSLVFHHVNPEDKKFPVNAKYIYQEIDLLIDEINKCILLCANCHGEIHYG